MRMMQQYGFVLSGGNPADRIIPTSLQSAGYVVHQIPLHNMRQKASLISLQALSRRSHSSQCTALVCVFTTAALKHATKRQGLSASS